MAKDTFFEKIKESEVKKLNEKVVTIRRDIALTIDEKSGSSSKQTQLDHNAQQEIDEFMKTNGIGLNKKIDLRTQAQKYYEAITEYYDGGLANEAEKQRQETLHNLKEIRLMDRYLVDFDQDFAMGREAQEQKAIGNYLDGNTRPTSIKQKEIKDIKVWSDIV